MKFLRELYLIPVYLYKGLISPFSGKSCGYIPTCSTYTLEAVRKHGIIKGTIIGAMRIGRCTPRYFAGPDPVPETFSFKALRDEYIVRRKPKDFDKLVPPKGHK